MKLRTKIIPSVLIAVGAAAIGFGCSTGPKYKTQAYAKEQTSRTMEYDYGIVWKGIRDALQDHKIREANEEKGIVETDWAYSTSNDKYLDVVINQQPRRKYLQTRYRYRITAQKQMIGVLVDVNIEEEVEKLKSDGTFQRWHSVDEPGTSRPHEMLMRIEQKIQGGRHL